MKKVLFLIFASLLVLGACGQNGDNSNKDDNKKSESKSDKKSNDPKKDKKSDSKDKSKDSSGDDKQQASSDDNNNDTSNNESESTSKNDNRETQSANGNNERPQGKQAQATQQNNNQKVSNNQQQANTTPVNDDMPVAHDGGQNGYGHGDYEEAKRATEQGKAQNGGKLEGVGGSWAVQDGQDYDSWRKAQVDWQNAVDSTSQPAK